MSPRVPKWYLVVVGAVAVQRLAELSLSRSNESGIRGVRAASSTYPLMLLAHLGLVTLPLVEVALRGSVRRPRWPWVVGRQKCVTHAALA
jgi:isoprenylcysteine carboxyl methyltransferase (ICMT) family protein YpbQ